MQPYIHEKDEKVNTNFEARLLTPVDYKGITAICFTSALSRRQTDN